MEIQLEQIELVKDRTGVSYKEAKEALEFAEGNVVDAIIYIEENINHSYKEEKNSSVEDILNAAKEAVKKGNVTKIRVYKGDDLIVNLPVTVGAVAAVLFPWGVVASAIGAAATKCRVELVKDDGTVIDVNAKTSSAVEVIKNKSSVVVDELKDKGQDIYSSAIEKGKEIYQDAFEKGKDLYEDAVTKGEELYANTKVKVTDHLENRKGAEVFDTQDFDFEEQDGNEGVDSSSNDSSDNL